MPKRKALPFNDKQWRLEHCYSIIDKNSKKQILTPNKFQRKILRSTSKRKMVLKARQIGISTAIEIDMFDAVVNTPNITAVIIAHEDDAIRKLFRIVQRAYDNLHPLLKPELYRGGGSLYEMFFPKLNSRISCSLQSRSETIHRLHISEAAFIKRPEQIKATIESVPIDGEISMESTPNGLGNFFYDKWIDPTQEYGKFFFPWYMHDEYQIPTTKLKRTEEEMVISAHALQTYGINITDAQIAFRRFKFKDLKNMFYQEYPEDDASCFLSSGASIMDLFLIQDRLNNCTEPIQATNNINVYKPYNGRHTYVIGADTSEGVGKDWSVASVIDEVTREQVAVLRCQAKPHEFAHRIVELAGMFHKPGRPWPMVGVERNNHGHAVLLELGEHVLYQSLFKHRDDRYGWITDRITRPLMLDAFVDGVENNTITLRDKTTLHECLTFMDVNGKAQAAPGKHDDCIMATAIAIQICLECSTGQLYEKIKEKILI